MKIRTSICTVEGDVPIVREVDVEEFDVEAERRVVDGLYLVLSQHQTLYHPRKTIAID